MITYNQSTADVVQGSSCLHSTKAIQVQTWFAAVLILVAPLFALFTWPLGPGVGVVRSLSLPVVACQVALILLACRAGFSPSVAWRRLSPLTRTASAIWMGLALLSALLAQSSSAAALFLFLGTALHGLLGLAVYDRAIAGWLKRQDHLYLAIALGAFGYAVIAIVCVITARGSPGFDWTYFGLGVSHVRQIGFYGLTLIGIAAGLVANRSGVARPILLVALLFAGWFLVGWSGGRAAFGAAVASSALLLFLAGADRRRAFRLFMACALGGLLLSQATAPAPGWGAGTILKRSVPADKHDFSSGRTIVWQETWQRIQDRPVIGHGQGQFIYEVRVIPMLINHPHNATLQFLYQWGFAGTLAIILTLLSSCLMILRAAGERIRPALPGIGAFSGLVLMSQLEGSLYHAFPLMIVVICLALIASTARAGASPSPQSHS